MKHCCLFLILIILPKVLIANDSFSDHFEYESSFMPKHADEITQYFTNEDTIKSKQRISVFKEFNQSLNEQIKLHPNKAVLWFSKGLNFKNRLLALEQQKSLGAHNIQAVIKQTVDYMQKSFNKAIQLDQGNKKKLTARMYGTMKHSLRSDDRISALQNELSLGGSGDNETIYWFSHWDVIGSLQDEGRFDEAENALYHMQNEMKSAGLDQSEFAKIYQKAKTNLAKDHTLSPEKEKAMVAEVTPKPINKQSNKKSFFENLQNKFKTYWLLVLLNAFVIISLIVAFIKRDKD